MIPTPQQPTPQNPTPSASTRRAGSRRTRRTPRSTRLFERAAGALIRIGGIGTIASVTLIVVFLVWVVAPLFLDASASARGHTPLAGETPRALACGIDDHQRIVWSLGSDGRVHTWSAADGAPLATRELGANGALPTAAAIAPEGAAFALGFDDGTVRVGRIAFTSELALREQRPDVWKSLGTDGRARTDGALAELEPDGRIRLSTLAIETAEPIRVFEPSADAGSGRIVALDRSSGATHDAVLALDARGELALVELEKHENLISGAIEWDSKRHALPFDHAAYATLPARVLLDENAGAGYLVWNDGRLLRYDLRDPEHARATQSCDLVPGDARLTAITFLIGKATLVAADSNGAVSAWFPVKPREASTSDGIELVRAHVLAERGPAIRALATSARGRVIAAADEHGSVRLWNVTNERLLATIAAQPAGGAPLEALAFAPKEDGLLALDAHGAGLWALELRHPEAGMAALFRPVWYEGYEHPEHVWQSSSGTDSFEPKLGLAPLVFGTLKATFYSMVLAVPIALLAALYTSQFLAGTLRARIKSAVEMMASLPSVVLGFLAAVVVAPIVEHVVPALLLAFFTVPFALLAGAHLVQLLPERFSRRVDGAARLVFAGAAIAVGVWLAFAAAPLVEHALFAGDLRAWLDGRVGSAFGGWLMLVLPLAAAAVVLAGSRTLEPVVRARSAAWSRPRAASMQALVFACGALAVLALAALVSSALTGLGLDPRGGVFDTYVQRNSLVVGAMMGFAVIPIVYTIADDALSAVPAHLKLASIGAGATPWQTAVRVVLPTAASGIFSAIMVGLGRAVGETMIVLMATGNTPVMSWNVFDGFRTLSANIAVELPEAVRQSTHYRTLFFAALCLFAITFVFNTAAELVRQRYRKKAARL